MSHSVTREWIDRRSMIRSTANSIHELSTRGGLTQPLVTDGAGLVVGIADLDPSGLSPLVIQRALVGVPQVSYTRSHDVQSEKERLLALFGHGAMSDLSAHQSGCAPTKVDTALRALTRPPTPWLRQINPTGKISLSPSGKSSLGLPPSCPRGRGVGHRHRTLGWDAVDAAVSGVKCVRRAVFRERTAARRTYDAEAYGEVVWS